MKRTILLATIICGFLVACSQDERVPETNFRDELAGKISGNSFSSEEAVPTAEPTPADLPAPTATPEPTARALIQDERGISMVLIPAGAFEMGMDADRALAYCQQYYEPYSDVECERSSFEDEEPVHEVYLDAYYIDQYEVTNTAYRECVEEGLCAPPELSGSDTRDSYYGNPEFDTYPVIVVSWEDADTYCTWRGGRLPSEAEWEKAARGTDGWVFPWGDEMESGSANFCDTVCEFPWANPEFSDGHWDTSPVGIYAEGASPYGVYDMAGNVWEWTADWYGEDYYGSSPAENPVGPASGTTRVLRGGSWMDSAVNLRAARRFGSGPDLPYYDIGFRCAAPE